MHRRLVSFYPPFTERAKGDKDRAAIPVSAVLIGDEAQLVDTGDEGSEEAEVYESHENSGASGGRVPNHGVEGPEHGDHTDDE